MMEGAIIWAGVLLNSNGDGKMSKSLILLAAVVVGVLAMSVKAAPPVGGEPTGPRTPAQVPQQ